MPIEKDERVIGKVNFECYRLSVSHVHKYPLPGFGDPP